MYRIVFILTFFIFSKSFSQSNIKTVARSQWVYPGENGKLAYKTTERGDAVMDFSAAGYKGGGVAFPVVTVRKTVKPSGADDTKSIQDAINEVSALPAKGGFRGAVLLAPGLFHCEETITITTSGVLLIGSGSGNNGTTIIMTGKKHSAIVISKNRTGQSVDENDAGDQNELTNSEKENYQTAISDSYIPSGATSFHVAGVKGLKTGDRIRIRRPITDSWISFMQMDDLTREKKHQAWLGKNRNSITERKIIAIVGNKITIDIPLPDSYEAKFLDPPGMTISKINSPDRISNVGVEQLHIQCPPLEIDYGHAPYSGIRIQADDCWVKDVFFEETMNTAVISGDRVTLQNVIVKHTYPNLGASKPGDFGIDGSQVLIDRCASTGDNQYFVWTTSLKPGPNVILNSTFRGHGSRIQPHMRWSTGLLVDNCTVIDGGIDFMNRGVAGSGHGWTMGWAVAWNCIAKTYIIQNPPGSANWAIGCIGDRAKTARLFDTSPILDEGIFDSHDMPVAPQSLYLAQLLERKGLQALKNTGYASNTPAMFTNKKIKPSPPLLIQRDKNLGPDLAMHRPVNTSNIRGREFGGEKALDGDEKTYWATADGIEHATIEIDVEGPLDINAVEIVEANGFEGRVQEYKVEGMVQSDWLLLSQGTAIGKQKIDKFPANTVWKVRVTILKAKDYPAITKIGLYKFQAVQ